MLITDCLKWTNNATALTQCDWEIIRKSWLRNLKDHRVIYSHFKGYLIISKEENKREI